MFVISVRFYFRWKCAGLLDGVRQFCAIQFLVQLLRHYTYDSLLADADTSTDLTISLSLNYALTETNWNWQPFTCKTANIYGDYLSVDVATRVRSSMSHLPTYVTVHKFEIHRMNKAPWTVAGTCNKSKCDSWVRNAVLIYHSPRQDR